MSQGMWFFNQCCNILLKFHFEKVFEGIVGTFSVSFYLAVRERNNFEGVSDIRTIYDTNK